jgi:hypothetical protein
VKPQKGTEHTNKLLTFLLTLFVPLCGFAMQGDSQPTVLRKAPAPQQEILEGYNRGHCVSLHHQVRVCKQLSDERDVFVVEERGKQVGVWPARTFLGETSDFEVLTADFNHDGLAEMIVANHDGTSNGLGVDYWTISIFPDSRTLTVDEPLTFSVEEYGSFGTFVVEDTWVRILTTRWVWTKDPKGKRDIGLYLVGHWWRYEAGQLVPQTSRAPIARRYLFSFANERGNTGSSDRIPYRWFRNVKAERLKPEQITGPSSRSESGTIQDLSAVAKTGSQRTVKITFRTDDGSTVTYNYPRPEDEPNAGPSIDFIGDTKSGRIYPIRYFPARIDSWLKGKRARLRTYGDEIRTEKILWLDR